MNIAEGITIFNGDCLDVLPLLEKESVDAIVTDPPYGLEFMGKDWDHGVPGKHFWCEVLRVAKPGAYLLAFGGTRTFHRLVVAIEDAGWEIRDTVMWVYGSGFPKSLDVSKAIDKAAGAEREVVGYKDGANLLKSNAFADRAINGHNPNVPITAPATPATPAAKQWSGWGTALKPAYEPIIVARKPLVGTVAENVLRYGTGAINIDGCRVECAEARPLIERFNQYRPENFDIPSGSRIAGHTTIGRWPANLIHDGSDDVVELFPVTTSGKPVGKRKAPHHFGNKESGTDLTGFGDTGSAARFFQCCSPFEVGDYDPLFYTGKATKKDRDEGCGRLDYRQYSHDGRQTPIDNAYQRNNSEARNHHPTVKPTDLMRYLCRLVTQPNGVVLDPFMGSGSTGKAAILENFRFIGIEKEAEYVEIAKHRLENALAQGRLEGI